MPQEPGRRRLLLVEDDHDLRSVLAELLHDAGFEVLEAEDGQAALEQLRTGSPPDAIILDLTMPRMSGWEFRAQQKQDPSLASTPVVVLSASTRAEARAMDADLIFNKPFELRALLEGLSRVISLRERQKSEEKLGHQDRIASLATLASGLAHEINNPLTGLLGSIDLAQRVCRSPSVPSGVATRLEHHLNTAREAAVHIQGLIKDVSAFARPSDYLETVDVRPLLEAATGMISSEIERHAELETLHEPVPPVRASRSHLLQVFLNLLSNAAHALLDAAPGKIRTRTYTSEAGEAVVEVSDTGCGIASEHLTRIFDPFFTTKAPGRGTGLGLSLCHAFVIQLGGQIQVRSELGKGSTFRVVLPAAASAARPKIDAPVAPTVRARGRVLVVDDEPLVCSVLEHVLNDYEVVIVRDGRSALELLSQQQTFDIVLCDLNLPDVCGLDIWREASEARPALRDRFLIMTGGVRGPGQARELENAGLPVIEKPFDLRILLGLIDARVRPSQPPRAGTGKR